MLLIGWLIDYGLRFAIGFAFNLNVFVLLATAIIIAKGITKIHKIPLLGYLLSLLLGIQSPMFSTPLQ